MPDVEVVDSYLHDEERGNVPLHPAGASAAAATLQDVERHLGRLQLSAFLIDGDRRLSWVSPELRTILGVGDGPEEVGIGEHVAEALLREVWSRGIHPDSRPALFEGIAPFLFADLRAGGRDAASAVPDALRPLVGKIETSPAPPIWSTSFRSLFRAADGSRGDEVQMLLLRLFDDIGWLALLFVGVRPSLLALLGRGDPSMHERMARLIEPGHRAAAILFCDLHGSGALSRRLPSAEYFALVRRLWTGIDQAVGENQGLVGKHAGDGATAFFLADELGGPSAAVAAAVTTARRIHDVSEDVFRDVADSDHLMKVALHWGANLFMGQLVPGGRLDVTALGDEVNEASRIEQATGPHETVASKQLIEQLDVGDAERIGVDPQELRYTVLADLAAGQDKVVRDAGTIAVAQLPR